MRFGASRPFDHARSIAFCTFLSLAWLWTTVFFSACLKDTVDVWWCTRTKLALEKVQICILSDFHPFRSRLSLAITVTPGQLSWPEPPGRAKFKRNNPSHSVRNASLKYSNKMRKWNVCLQVRIPQQWSSTHSACILYSRKFSSGI